MLSVILKLNSVSIPECAKGAILFINPSICVSREKSRDKTEDWPTSIDTSTTDTLPDFGNDSDYDSDTDDVNVKIHKDTAIETWDPELFEIVKLLQEAPANKGSVDLMKSLGHGGRFVAVKRMPNSWVTESPMEFARLHSASAEQPWVDIGIVNYLHEVGFVNICEPLGVFKNIFETFVVSDFANQGELFAWLDYDPPPSLEREAMIRPIMSQLFAAVRQIHDLGIAHRDISLENVMLSDDGNGTTVKLIDFGMATTWRYSYERSGKRSYMAPEVLRDAPYDAFLSDTFALGVVLFSVACREYPWKSVLPQEECHLYSYVERYGFRKFMQRRKLSRCGEYLAEVLSEPAQELLAGLLQFDPATRFSLGEKCWADSEAVPRCSVWDVEWW